MAGCRKAPRAPRRARLSRAGSIAADSGRRGACAADRFRRLHKECFSAERAAAPRRCRHRCHEAVAIQALPDRRKDGRHADKGGSQFSPLKLIVFPSEGQLALMLKSLRSMGESGLENRKPPLRVFGLLYFLPLAVICAPT